MDWARGMEVNNNLHYAYAIMQIREVKFDICEAEAKTKNENKLIGNEVTRLVNLLPIQYTI